MKLFNALILLTCKISIFIIDIVTKGPSVYYDLMPWFLIMSNTGQRNETEQSSAPAAATLPSVLTHFTSLTEFLVMATSFVLIIADP